MKNLLIRDWTFDQLKLACQKHNAEIELTHKYLVKIEEELGESFKVPEVEPISEYDEDRALLFILSDYLQAKDEIANLQKQLYKVYN